MKSFPLLIALIGLSWAGCTGSRTSVDEATDTNGSLNPAAVPPGYIEKDTANTMIQSYLDALPANDTMSLRSLLIDADLLRDYLSNDSIHGVKIMFAHTMSYIDKGNQGVPAGYKSGALTVVLAGYSASGDYVLGPNGMVPNRSIPCPANCPTGTAAQPTIP